MKLDHIYLEGYKSIAKLDLELGDLNILIGANGSGKSNFISLFRLLNEMVLGNFQKHVVLTGGSETYLHHGGKKTSQILLKLKFGEYAYEARWMPTSKEQFAFISENCKFYSEKDNVSSNIPSQPRFESRLALPFPQRNLKDQTSRVILERLSKLKVFHFHDTSESARVKKSGDMNDNEYLRRDGENLAAFLYGLSIAHPQHYEKIRDTIRLVAPFFEDFHLIPVIGEQERIRLAWKQRGSDYPYQVYHLSDGTLRFMCLATLLLQPNPPATILIDEPELGLHPYAINILGALIRAASINTQLIVSTQSVELVNQFEPENLLIVDRDEQKTSIRRLEKKEVSEWLDNYSLGELWEKNVFGGVLENVNEVRNMCQITS
jgi:predicted ATPase